MGAEPARDKQCGYVEGTAMLEVIRAGEVHMKMPIVRPQRGDLLRTRYERDPRGPGGETLGMTQATEYTHSFVVWKPRMMGRSPETILCAAWRVSSDAKTR